MSLRHVFLQPSVAILSLCLLAAACGRSAETRRQYAELYAQRGDYVHATEEWTRAITKKPADATLWLGRGRSQRKSRSFEAARSDLVHAYSLDPRLVDARFEIVESWRDEGRWDEAIGALAGLETYDAPRVARLTGLVRRDRAVGALRELLVQIDRLMPEGRETFVHAMGLYDLRTASQWLARPENRAEVQALRAKLDAAASDVAAARAALTQAAASASPVAPEAACDLAELDVEANDFAAARARLAGVVKGGSPVDVPTDVAVRAQQILASADEGAGDLASSLAHLDAAVSMKPNDLDLAFTRAMLLLRAGRVGDAETDARRVAADRYRHLQIALLDGAIRLTKGDARGAVPSLQVVTATAPEMALGHLFLGLALSSSDTDSSTARAEFKRAVEISPRYFLGHLARSAAESTAGSPSVAVDSARRCTEIQPERPAGWLALGQALVRRGAQSRDPSAREGDFQAAAVALAAAMRLDPKGIAGQEAMALHGFVTGSGQGAESTLQTALSGTKDPDLFVTLAALLAADERTSDAERCLREALAASPKHVRAAGALATLLATHGRKDEAEATLRALIDADPASGDAALLAARYLAADGRADAARDALRNACARIPRHAGLCALRTTMAVEAGDLAEAETAAALGLAADPSVRLFHVAGALAALRGDGETARARLEASTQRFPDDGVLIAARGLAAARRGDRATAVTVARDMAHRAGADPYAMAAAVVAATAAGVPDEARSMLADLRSLPAAACRALQRHAETALKSPDAAATMADLHLLVVALDGLVAPKVRTTIETRAETLAAASGDDVLLLDRLAAVAASRGDVAGATALYVRVLKVQPGLPAVHERLANLYAAQGNAKAALDASREAIRTGGKGARLHVLAGDLSLAAGLLDDARVEYTAAVAADSDCADALVGLGRVCAATRDASGARNAFEKAVVASPAHPAANACLAELIADIYPERAEMLVRRAVAAAPRLVAARVSLGVVLSAMGRRDEAAAEMRKAAREFPGDARIQAMHGVTAMAIQRLDEAQEAFEAAVRLDPRNGAAELHLGMIAERAGDLGAARRRYERVVELEPKNAIAANNLAAVIERSNGDLEKARALAESAVRLSDGAAPPLDTLGWVLYRQGRFDEAAARLTDAVTAAPDDLSARWHLAAALDAGRRPEEALRELDRLAVAGEFPERAEADALRRKLAK